MNGTLYFVNEVLGYGVLRCDHDGSDVIVRLSKIHDTGVISILSGQRYEFDMLLNQNTGRISLRNIKIINKN